MKEYYYICNKCIDNQEIECYTIGIIGERACDICRENTNPKNLFYVSAKDALRVLYWQMSKPTLISEIFPVRQILPEETIIYGVPLDDIWE
jgi:hypothetical protein